MDAKLLKDTVETPEDSIINNSKIETGKYSGISDAIIWEDFKNGSEDAFIHIYSSYFKELMSFGYQFSSDKQLVEDCIQDLFVHLRGKRKNISQLKSSIRLYLFQALKRRILDYEIKLRKMTIENEFNKIHMFEFILPYESHLINQQDYDEKVKKLNSGLNRLTVRQREAVYYFFFKDMSYEDIKDLMGLSNVKSARNLIYKALTALKPFIAICTFLIAYQL